jgi:hypothetical protein
LQYINEKLNQNGDENMVELFAKEETTSAFKGYDENLKNEISYLSDEKILNSDFEKWVEYFKEKYTIEPIQLYLECITKELSETKIKQANSFSRYVDEPSHYLIDGYKIAFNIPYDGDSNLLHLRPSRFFFARFYVDKIVEPNKEKMGYIIYSLEYIKTDLEGKDAEFISNGLQNKFKNHMECINNVNIEVKQYNASLENNIRAILEKRKQKAKDYLLMGEKLNIPLSLDPKAPNSVPIILKREVRSIPTIPTQKPQPKEYEISDKDYVNIKNIINLACHSMEKTAQTFNKLNEEELRDIILSNLNTHYQGLATGETFSKVGKTDIRIQFENKAAYIGECKIWHGEKKVEEAIEQLFSYTTWRDSKTSLIVFNKDNKDFSKLVSVIDNYLKNCKMCTARMQINKNEWQCTFYKTEGSTDLISVQVVIYDLFLEKKKE